MIELKQPSRWDISIWKDDNDTWHMSYTELFRDTPLNREIRKNSIPLFKTKAFSAGCMTHEVKEISKNELIGITITNTSKSLVVLADQVVSEFIGISNLGNITLRDVLMIGVVSCMTLDEEKGVIAKVSEDKVNEN